MNTFEFLEIRDLIFGQFAKLIRPFHWLEFSRFLGHPHLGDFHLFTPAKIINPPPPPNSPIRFRCPCKRLLYSSRSKMSSNPTITTMQNPMSNSHNNRLRLLPRQHARKPRNRNE